jgi:diguanylate cyclase (GGDEF)-like protein
MAWPLALLLATFFRPNATAADTPLPVLTTARQAHVLPREEAARGYPIHLERAQVTFFQSNPGGLFLMDSTDGIFADIRDDQVPNLNAGDIVNVDGVTGAGDVAPVILRTQLRIVGHAPLPDAPLVSFDRVATGAWDAKWVSVEGIVRSVRRPAGITAYDGHAASSVFNLSVTLASGQDLVDVITLNPDGQDHSSLVDAKVRLRAAVGSRFNQRKQLIGVHVYMPDFSYMQIEEPAPSDPFSLPVRDTASVMRLNTSEPGHRVHIHGVVTSMWGTHQFSLMDAAHGIFVHTGEPVSLSAGDVLDVVGFPTVGDYTSVLDGALYRRAGHGRPVPPAVLTAAEGLAGAHDAEPVEIDGQLLYESRSPLEQDLVLTDKGTTFSAALPATNDTGFPQGLQPGSRLRLTGICYIEVTPSKTPRDLKILLESPADVVVLSRPSWWTTRNTLILASLLSAVVFVVVSWNVVLRGRVRAQTQVIRKQLQEAHTLRLLAEAAHQEKSKSLASILTLQRDLLSAQEKLRFQATHDALTGLWNRGALLDLLHNEIERTMRTQSSMGILMLDVDHFKQINDTLGHLTGDAVLGEIGQRIARATRPYDIAGRYGGEEFLVILPSCDREQTESSAERIRAAISSVPFVAVGTQISLTVSIGATVTLDYPQTETELLSLADLALYQAKHAGRNCTILRTTFQEERAETV